MCQMFAGQDPARYEYVTRRLRLNGQSTSIRLERAFWGIVDQMSSIRCHNPARPSPPNRKIRL